MHKEAAFFMQRAIFGDLHREAKSAMNDVLSGALETNTDVLLEKLELLVQFDWQLNVTYLRQNKINGIYIAQTKL